MTHPTPITGELGTPAEATATPLTTAGTTTDPAQVPLPPALGSVIATALLLAAVLLLAGGPDGRLRLRALAARPCPRPAPHPVLRPVWVVVGGIASGGLAWAMTGPVAGVVAGAVAVAAGVAARRRQRHRDDDPGQLAARWELLAVCLEAGLPVASAVAAAAEPLAGATGAQLRQVAALLGLGADPGGAWQAAERTPALVAFARAAGRSAVTGAALAQVARSESTRIRADLIDTAQARAQRAGVHIAGPLGLCFLPSFLVLGIAPVVVGLAGDALARW